MQTALIDTHAHIYLPEFDNDNEKIMSDAQAAGVKEIYLPAVDSTTHDRLLQTEAAFPACKAMMGLHPCSVNEGYERELEIVQEQLARRNFIAVGEIGLDFYWDKTFVAQQHKAFEAQIELALQYNLPVSIHSRNATEECIETVARYSGLRGVFHCFSGTAEQARRIVALGLYLGIGGVVTFKNGGFDKVLSETGIGAVVLETDAPYLAPVPHRGKRNQPAYTKLVAEKIAALVNLPVEEVATVTTRNAEKLFSNTQKT